MGVSCIAEFQRGKPSVFPLKPICSAGTRRVAGAGMFTTSCSAGKCWGYASVKGCPTAYCFACPLTLIHFLAALLVKCLSAHYKCAKGHFLFAF